MKIRQAMHEGVAWVGPEAPVAELARRMRREDIGAIPVGENDRLIGMVTDRDIAIRGFANGDAVDNLTARDVMTDGIIWCRADDDIEDAAELMQSRRIRRLPVIDENRRLVGMVSLGDLSHAADNGVTAEVARAVSAHHG
jgi:CBS domain-containing protein